MNLKIKEEEIYIMNMFFLWLENSESSTLMSQESV